MQSSITGNTILVLGGNELSLSAIKTMMNGGYDVIVLDRNVHKSIKRLGIPCYDVDFFDYDYTKKSIDEIKFDGIMPLNDFAVNTAARISIDRKLPGWSLYTAELCTNKSLLKKCWKDAGLCTPAFISFKMDELDLELSKWNHYPCIIKPSFAGGGSRGVSLVNSEYELRDFILMNENLFNKKGVVIEQFVTGVEHQIEVIVSNGEPEVLMHCDKKNYNDSFTVAQHYHYPGEVSTKRYNELKKTVINATYAMKADNGALHFEIITTPNESYLIEVGGRPGGGYNFDPVCEYVTGHKYPVLLANVLTRKHLGSIDNSALQNVGLSHFPMPPKNIMNHNTLYGGTLGFDKILGDEDIVGFHIYWQIDQVIAGLVDDHSRPGYVMVKNSNNYFCSKKVEEVLSCITYEISNEGKLLIKYGK